MICWLVVTNLFYKVEGGQKKYYDIPSKTYKTIPGRESFIILESKSENVVWKNTDSKNY
jgi:3-hydroxyacyl-CoA dehydrogenase